VFLPWPRTARCPMRVPLVLRGPVLGCASQVGLAADENRPALRSGLISGVAAGRRCLRNVAATGAGAGRWCRSGAPDRGAAWRPPRSPAVPARSSAEPTPCPPADVGQRGKGWPPAGEPALGAGSARIGWTASAPSGCSPWPSILTPRSRGRQPFVTRFQTDRGAPRFGTGPEGFRDARGQSVRTGRGRYGGRRCTSGRGAGLAARLPAAACSAPHGPWRQAPRGLEAPGAGAPWSNDAGHPPGGGEGISSPAGSRGGKGPMSSRPEPLGYPPRPMSSRPEPLDYPRRPMSSRPEPLDYSRRPVRTRPEFLRRRRRPVRTRPEFLRRRPRPVRTRPERLRRRPQPVQTPSEISRNPFAAGADAI
jgi:hypothetical protein